MKSLGVPVLGCLLAFSASTVLAAWVPQDSGTTLNLHSVNFDHSTDSRTWVCGDEGTILYTSNGGTTWVRQESGTTNDLHGIVFHEENGCVIAVGEHGTILRTTDRGTTWTNIPSPTTHTLRDASDFRFYAVGDAGTIVKSTDFGLTWALIESGTETDLHSVIGLEPVPTAVGDGGLILRGNPQGTSWQPLTSGTTAGLNGIPLFSTQLVAGDDGTILKSTNSGTDWLPMPSGTDRSLHSIADANGAVYAVGEAGTIVKSTNNGNTWGIQMTPVGQDLNGAFFYLFPNVGYAVGDGGTILKTTDGGGPIVTGVESPLADSAISLQTCAPNPFRASTTIAYSLARGSHVSLRVFDASGREVAVLEDGYRDSGSHVVSWAPTGLANGVYSCRLQAGGAVATARIVYTR